MNEKIARIEDEFTRNVTQRCKEEGKGAKDIKEMKE